MLKGDKDNYILKNNLLHQENIYLLNILTTINHKCNEAINGVKDGVDVCREIKYMLCLGDD